MKAVHAVVRRLFVYTGRPRVEQRILAYATVVRM
jgi:hypothetical protein